MKSIRQLAGRWTLLAPIVGLACLAATWGRDLGPALVTVVGLVLAAAVLAAVQHAEIIAHRVGEPFGSLVLAVAVTVIEAGLILTLMVGGGGTASTLARDTVFSAVMICLNGIVGVCLLVGAFRHRFTHFNAEGTGAALATIATLATLCLVVPNYTTSRPGPEFSPAQLAFAALASALLYAAFVLTQTVRHRDFFLPVTKHGEIIDEDVHADPPTNRQAGTSLALLFAALVAVVGLAKVTSPSIESGVSAAGLPQSFVGVIIALMVLLPEGIAAVRAARRERIQTSLNLALGSTIATIGLTIPTIAFAKIWIDTPLMLGLSSLQVTLLALTLVVSVLTVVPGRATRMQGAVHLALFVAFVFLASNP